MKELFSMRKHNNRGAGANTSQRVAWAKQLSREQAKDYSLKNIFDSINQDAGKEKWW
jgi:hypothetical protein